MTQKFISNDTEKEDIIILIRCKDIDGFNTLMKKLAFPETVIDKKAKKVYNNIQSYYYL